MFVYHQSIKCGLDFQIFYIHHKINDQMYITDNIVLINDKMYITDNIVLINDQMYITDNIVSVYYYFYFLLSSNVSDSQKIYKFSFDFLDNRMCLLQKTSDPVN